MKVLFVGPFPMPLHGFSFMNSCVALEFRKRGFYVFEFDVAPRGALNLSLVYIKYLRVLISCLFLRSKAIVYIGLSGGNRQLFDVIFYAFARIFFLKVVVHHHSFAYINKPNFLSRFVLFFLKGSQHVVLSSNMGLKLKDVYGIERSNIVYISNSFFLPENKRVYINAEDSNPQEILSFDRNSRDESIFVVGFLSNITRAKGIFIFFDLLDRMKAEGVSYHARIAGPIDSDIFEEFNARLNSNGQALYLGAVYGDAKVDFFNSIDYFVFPTIYANEAEPVSIIEALSAGIPVAALGRGCIPDMLNDECGVCVEDVEIFIKSVILEINRFQCSREFFIRKSLAAKKQFNHLRYESMLNFSSLIEKL